MSQSGVEWSFVDYGGANFYVASYRREDASAPGSETPQRAESPEAERSCCWAECIPLFRCWSTAGTEREAA